ncbi:MAG: RtcB family protein, partial [Candidatus Marinimicrobia bacterium]|nr:RtcB family protein [Candidatus Neomarinimicrobiota bacterium]
MVQLKQINDYIWEVPKTGKMRVPGRIYADRELMKGIANDPCIEQVQNVAHLPGIIQYSFAMPDIHWGYGFPIGGVAAMDIDEGVISPGGVGYDINCGVRLLSTGLHRSELQPQIRTLLAQLFRDIPSGVGSQGAIPNLSIKALDKILLNGVTSAVNMGFGSKEDILFIEEHGCLKGADPGNVSQHAKLRGSKQIGTLGSGNHFLEVDYVEEIYDDYSAEVLGLKKDQIVVIIHTGSRGLGYQVCTDHLKMTQKAVEKYRIELPDRQLACSPIQSPEG